MYVGRFAPSPTGDLHLGSLYIALASYLDAKSHQGQWLIRMDDVDQHRCSPRHANRILDTLAAFNLISDQTPLYQSHQAKAYQEYIDQLQAKQKIFYCTCSRKTLANHPRYPGFCRTKNSPPKHTEFAIRLTAPPENFEFNDLWFGNQASSSESIGDIIIFRKDGFAAYHLATVVDDYLQKVTHIIRGSDLLSVTPTQMIIQTALGFQKPTYGHLPLVLGADGEKLSKGNLSHPIHADDPKFDPMLMLEQCRPWLGLDQSNFEHCDHPKQWLELATSLWDRAKIPSVKSFPYNGQNPTI